MKTLTIDGSAWRDPEDFYRDFLVAVSAPSWHGRNLDALRDSLVTGSINGVSPPFAVEVLGADVWPDPLVAFIGEVESIFSEARSEGVQIELVLPGQ